MYIPCHSFLLVFFPHTLYRSFDHNSKLLMCAHFHHHCAKWSQEDHANFFCALAECWCATDRPIQKQTRQASPDGVQGQTVSPRVPTGLLPVASGQEGNAKEKEKWEHFRATWILSRSLALTLENKLSVLPFKLGWLTTFLSYCKALLPLFPRVHWGVFIRALTPGAGFPTTGTSPNLFISFLWIKQFHIPRPC